MPVEVGINIGVDVTLLFFNVFPAVAVVAVVDVVVVDVVVFDVVVDVVVVVDDELEDQSSLEFPNRQDDDEFELDEFFKHALSGSSMYLLNILFRYILIQGPTYQ